MNTQTTSNIAIIILSLVSFATLMLNLYGQTKTMRFRNFKTAPLDLFRFGRETPIPYKEAMTKMDELLAIDDDLLYAQQATRLTNQSLAHLEWTNLDPQITFQIVPLWENPILYFLGKFSGLPHYQRYNFTYYRRTIERGFGICGDASMVLSQLLDRKSISHRIVAFNEHVMVEADIEGRRYALDPDFGIAMECSIEELSSDSALTSEQYLKAGYPESDAELMSRILVRRCYCYNSVYEFVKKRYVLERISYYLFWYGPFIGIGFATMIFLF